MRQLVLQLGIEEFKDCSVTLGDTGQELMTYQLMGELFMLM